MIAALSIAFGSNGATRIRSAAWLSAWFVLVVILAGTRALYYEHGLGAPGLGIAVALPILILCITVTRINHCATLFTGCRCGCLSACTRFVRLASVLSFFTAVHRLAAPFAPVAGCGDIFVGAMAVPIAWLAYRQITNARAIVWTWNLLGIADLIAAVGLGVTSSPGPARLIFAEPSSAIMTTLPWLLIPGFLVPLLFAVHIGIFVRLVNARKLALTPTQTVAE